MQIGLAIGDQHAVFACGDTIEISWLIIVVEHNHVVHAVVILDLVCDEALGGLHHLRVLVDRAIGADTEHSVALTNLDQTAHVLRVVRVLGVVEAIPVELVGVIASIVAVLVAALRAQHLLATWNSETP